MNGAERDVADTGTMLDEYSDTALPLSTTYHDDETSVGGSDPGNPAMPTKLGRYEIHGVLGRGGMGVVYAAEDPELERGVALKVLSPGRHGTSARGRLQREARTLAKLAHPNVVAIHDVGEQGEQLYIAMERIEGQTLGAWLKASERGWSVIVEIFVDAGRGLVAAHDAGLIHRDFKPDNVLVDERGTPRVVDFGLARFVEDIDEQAPTSDGVTGISGDSLRTLTRPGAIMGTPAYMAPEQHLGDPSDARTDQFAFCVSLWEALYGERPFAGKTLAALSNAVVEGRVSIGPRRGVPRSFRRALLRGLESDPRRRWPSMAALLAALEGIIRRRRVTALASVGGALTLALISGTWAFASQPTNDPSPAICVDTSTRVDAVWDPTRRTATQASLDRAGGESIAATRAQILTSLDRYADALREGLREACLDTEQRQLISAELRDRRVACLVGRLDALDASAAVLESVERQDLRQATRLVAALPSVERCADLGYLEARLAGPADEADAAQVAEARAILARARAAIVAVRIDEADATLREASTLARSLDYAPLSAELLFEQGRLAILRSEYEDAASQIEDAYHAALGLGHDELAITAGLELISTHGSDLREPERGLAWARHAASLIERSGDERSRAKLLHARGQMALARDEYDEAVELFEAAIAIAREQTEAHPVDLANALSGLSNALTDLDRFAEAEAVLDEAIALELDALGEFSPSTARLLGNLGLLLWKRGDFESSLEHHEHARAVFERAYGPQHVSQAGTRLNLGMSLNAVDRPEEAIEVIERGLEVVRQLDPPIPVLEARLYNTLAHANYLLGRGPASREAYTNELAVLTKAKGEDDPERAGALLGLAEVSNAMGEHDDALGYVAQVLALLGDTGDPGQRADAHLGMAEAYLALGQHDRARAEAITARDGFEDAEGRYKDEQAEAIAILEQLE